MAKRPASENSSSESPGHEAKKPRRLTSTQLDRKRTLDRAAQRNSRARTRNHIEYLEGLVKSLRADSDDRVADLLHQLDRKQAEILRLRGALNTIGKQLALVEQETPCDGEYQLEPAAKDAVGSEKNDCQLMSPISPDSPPVADLSPIEDPAQVFALDEPDESTDDIPMLPIASPSVEVTDTTAVTAADSPHPRCQSITQLASSITSNTNLEGRLWYLAGAILNQILAISPSSPITTAFDEEIAIRAVFHGWTSVIERYSLDCGWQWLKELDERIYFHQSAPVRLMHLRNSRLLFLKQLFPDNGWGALVPPFFKPRPLQEHVSHDPLIEHFPWPGLRERMLLSPLKFATNEFMDALRAQVSFTWNRDPKDMYTKDPLTGLYRYSDLITARFDDMRCYTMSQDFFVLFPELRADIPCNAVLPQSLFPAGLLESLRKDGEANSKGHDRLSTERSVPNSPYAHLVEGFEASLSAVISDLGIDGIDGWFSKPSGKCAIDAGPQE